MYSYFAPQSGAKFCDLRGYRRGDTRAPRGPAALLSLLQDFTYKNL
jgi:hypothetical protein